MTSSQPASTHASTRRTLAGTFDVRETRDGVRRLALRRRTPPAEILFTQVAAHDLPDATRELRIEALDAGLPVEGARSREFVLRAADRSYRIVARSVQVHELLAANEISPGLPRFGLRRRALWAALLWIARFDFGQRLIRSARRRGR